MNKSVLALMMLTACNYPEGHKPDNKPSANESAAYSENGDRRERSFAPASQESAPLQTEPGNDDDEGDAEDDSDRYAEAAPYLEMRVRVFDATGREMCCMTMKNLFDQLSEAGYSARFSLPDNDHMLLEGNLRPSSGRTDQMRFVFSGYGAVGEGWQVDMIGHNGKPISSRFSTWDESPSPSFIREFALKPVR